MITIKVEGGAWTGKSAISGAIAVALKEHGFDVSFVSLDHETLDDIQNLGEKLAAIVEKDERITIVEVQSSRHSLNDD